MGYPLVSIVITTKNEENNIENCLKSILEQTYQNIEIVVIDNFSTDKTKSVALKYINKFYEKGPERSAQRNYGMIEKSSGDYVMFVDADMILSPCLIENCVKEITESSLKALWIEEIILGTKFFSKCRRFERSFYNGTCIDGARFFVRSVFVENGGFDLKLNSAEDWDIDKKIGRENIKLLNAQKSRSYLTNNWYFDDFIRDSGVEPNNYNAVIYHNETKFNLKKYLNKKGYYADGLREYMNKWGRQDKDVKKQLGVFYRFFWVFFENGKWKKILSHPILALGMYFLRGLVGMVFLISKR